MAGLIATTGLCIRLGLRDADLSREMAGLREQETLIRGRQQASLEEYETMREQFILMRNVLTRRVRLDPVPGNPLTGQGSYLLVYWNPSTGKLMMADARLPALARDEQYQLWALYNGQPVDAGVLEEDGSEGAGFQKDIARAEAFAVTVEPRGGSKSPTLSKLCMMGKWPPQNITNP
jgi:hypothetical protein